MAFASILVFLGLLAVLAPVVSAVVTHYSPEEQGLGSVFAPPSADHLLGTDELGRDTLTRLVWGGRVSLGVASLAVVLLLLVGGTVGLVAGFYGGLADDALMLVVNILLAVPVIFILLLISTALPIHIGSFTLVRDGVTLGVVIALTGWGGVARLVRAETLSVRNREFVTSARAVGASGPRIIVLHVLPNVLSVMIVAASLSFGQVILTQAALDFIGLGVSPPTPTWGNMLIKAQSYLYQSLLLVFAPGATITLAVLAANIVGNAIRDAFDPRVK
jgi:peptide/nickel transport system permease protein